MPTLFLLQWIIKAGSIHTLDFSTAATFSEVKSFQVVASISRMITDTAKSVLGCYLSLRRFAHVSTQEAPQQHTASGELWAEVEGEGEP